MPLCLSLACACRSSIGNVAGGGGGASGSGGATGGFASDEGEGGHVLDGLVVTGTSLSKLPPEALEAAIGPSPAGAALAAAVVGSSTGGSGAGPSTSGGAGLLPPSSGSATYATAAASASLFAASAAGPGPSHPHPPNPRPTQSHQQPTGGGGGGGGPGSGPSASGRRSHGSDDGGPSPDAPDGLGHELSFAMGFGPAAAGLRAQQAHALAAAGHHPPGQGGLPGLTGLPPPGSMAGGAGGDARTGPGLELPPLPPLRL